MEEEEQEYVICPNCDANWGIEEISFQECDCCGYPTDEDAFSDDDIQEDFEDEYPDPNESL